MAAQIFALPRFEGDEVRKHQVRVALKKKENRDGSCAYMNRRTQRRQPIKSRVFRDSEYNLSLRGAKTMAAQIFALPRFEGDEVRKHEPGRDVPFHEALTLMSKCSNR